VASGRGAAATLRLVGWTAAEGAILCEAMSGTTVTYHAKGVQFTDKGAEKVREFLSAQGGDPGAAGLRVGVRGGGCSGFQYQLAFDEQHEGDAVFEHHGLRILVDNQSLPYVDGSNIDYVESLQGAGFQVVNPNVVAACGCGSSFRVAEDEQVSAV
jgi:iron-sulfur cluster assembly accessory protein